MQIESKNSLKHLFLRFLFQNVSKHTKTGTSEFVEKSTEKFDEENARNKINRKGYSSVRTQLSVLGPLDTKQMRLWSNSMGMGFYGGGGAAYMFQQHKRQLAERSLRTFELCYNARKSRDTTFLTGFALLTSLCFLGNISPSKNDPPPPYPKYWIPKRSRVSSARIDNVSWKYKVEDEALKLLISNFPGEIYF